MKKLWLSLALSMLLLFAPAQAEYWGDTVGRPIVCCEDRPGCQVLQTVMMGSFAEFSVDDSLSVRVLSAAFPRLKSVTEDDFAHFTEYFDVDPENLKHCYYIALGNCLWADAIVAPDLTDEAAENARKVLLLFLNPDGEENAAAQMAAIRSNLSEEAISILAENASVPADFVRYLLLPSEG